MKRILIIVLVLAIVLPSFAQKKLTLQEAISIALQGNSALIKMKNNLGTSESRVLNAYGQLLPNLGAQGQLNWSRVDDKGGNQVFYGGISTTTEASAEETRSYSIGIGGNFTLFDGLSNIASISQAKENLKASEYSINKQKQNIVFQTTDLYYIVLNADELLKVRDENVQYYNKFLETVQERNKLGSVAIADVYAAQVQAGNAELQFIQAQNMLESAKNNLLNYLALDVMDEYTFDDPFGGDKNIDTDKYMKDFDDVKAMVNAALDTRFDYKSQTELLNAAKSGITIARGGVLPSLSGSYNYGSSAAELNQMFNRKVLSFGLTLSIPIFSNFSVAYQIQMAEANYLNTQDDLSVLGRQIKIEVKQGYNDFVAAKKSLDVATKNVTAAAETRKINQERYNLGSATILDVLQAGRDYTDAQRSRINAAYDFYRQHDNLTNALGRLDFQKYE
jgi:outer membrane protein